MKKLLLLCTLALAVAAITSCNGGAVNDNADNQTDNGLMFEQFSEDVHIDDSVAYVLVFCSDDYLNRTLKELSGTSELDCFYTATDDLLWYLAKCRERLEEMGVKYYETTADKTIYYSSGKFRAKNDSDCGVLLIEHGKEPVFIDYLQFLNGWRNMFNE